LTKLAVEGLPTDRFPGRKDRDCGNVCPKAARDKASGGCGCHPGLTQTR